jgi:hypothetical protein
MVHVKIISSNSRINFDGEWDKEEAPESIINNLTKKAEDNGIPIMIRIENYGTFSISPKGRVLRGSLYDDDKIEHSRRRKGSN